MCSALLFDCNRESGKVKKDVAAESDVSDLADDSSDLYINQETKPRYSFDASVH